MKKLIFPILLLTPLFFFVSCDPEPELPTPSVYDYQIQIMSPDDRAKHVGDSIHLHVEFASGTDETVHHVKVRIYNADDNTEIYNQPDVAHVHAMGGSYAWHDDFVLSEANGVEGHTNWVLEAKVWGHEAGAEEETEIVEFHVHPE